MLDQKYALESTASIVKACKEAVASNDSGLLDAAAHDYRMQTTQLAASGQYFALSECVRAVGHCLKVTDLINLKGGISPEVLLKALCITNFHASQLPYKPKARDRWERRPQQEDAAPNAQQSQVIAKAITICKKDDIVEVSNTLQYFAKLGHLQAMAILFEHYLDQRMFETDQNCMAFGSLHALLIKGALHPALVKVLKTNAQTWTAQCENMAAVWIERQQKSSATNHYRLDLIEALFDIGFKEQAAILGKAYDKVNWGPSVTQEPCVSLRLQRLGVDQPLEILERSCIAYRSKDDVSWIEHLLTNDPAAEMKLTPNMVALFRVRSSMDRDKVFKAAQQVLHFQSTQGAKFSMDRRTILNRASTLCSFVIEQFEIGNNPVELKRILDEHPLPNDLTLKIKALKGLVLENALGL